MSYSAARETREGFETVRLRDDARGITVSTIPSVGNLAWELKAGGKDLLWFPFPSLAEFKRAPVLCGIPFLGPWANRLDRDGFFANGKEYRLNAGLGNLRRDENGLPIHGLLLFSPAWEVTTVSADARGAAVTCRLEFWRYPDLMEQFPFAHNLEITHRLRDGALEVATRIENLACEPMPVGIGYHPYFQLPGTIREAWEIRLAAREQVVLSPQLTPTGERRPAPATGSVPLDDVFTNLVRESSGKACFQVGGGNLQISVEYGPLYKAAVVYAPAGKPFICFEPMTAITNAFNLAHESRYTELQHVPPGGEWSESFRIVPSVS